MPRASSEMRVSSPLKRSLSTERNSLSLQAASNAASAMVRNHSFGSTSSESLRASIGSAKGIAAQHSGTFRSGEHLRDQPSSTGTHRHSPSSSDFEGTDDGNSSMLSEPIGKDSYSEVSEERSFTKQAPGIKSRDKAAVQVCIRIRPMEVSGGEKPREGVSPKVCWRYDSRSIAPAAVMYNGGNGDALIDGQSFTFDNIFPPMTRTDEIYRGVLSEIVQSTVEGYNGCIFAYGQTSSGKTYTMAGQRGSQGVIPLAAQEVFGHIKNFPEREFFLRLSYMEIYNEVVVDLLDPTKTGLQIWSSEAQGSGVVKVVGISEKVVTSAGEVMAILATGEAHRSVGSTDMNDKSSRSHTIVRLVIESKRKDPLPLPPGGGGAAAAAPGGPGPEYRVSSLNLVDLAGSECAAKSGSDGQRRTEGSYINKSLLTLATVIQRIITASGHVPYRDSKLTRILEPALGGNSRTAIICTVTPAVQHFGESLNTLKFAARAKRMKNKPILNDVILSAALSAEDLPLLKKYRDEIESLRREKERLEHINLQERVELEDKRGQVEELKMQIQRLERMFVDESSTLSKEILSQRSPRMHSLGRRGPASHKEDRKDEVASAGSASATEGGIEDTRRLFAQVKAHATELHDGLSERLHALTARLDALAAAAHIRDKSLQDFLSLSEGGGGRPGDDARTMLLLKQSARAVQEEAEVKEELLRELSAAPAGLHGVLGKLELLGRSIRKRDLNERGFRNIVRDLYNKISHHEARNAELNATLKARNAELAQQQEDMQLLEDNILELAGISNDLRAREHELEEERTRVSRLETEVADLTAAVEDLRAERNDLSKALTRLSESGAARAGAAARASAGAAESEELLQEVENLNEDIKRLKMENKTQRLQMQRMQTEMRKSQAAAAGEAERQARLEELNSRVASLQERNRMLEEGAVLKDQQMKDLIDVLGGDSDTGALQRILLQHHREQSRCAKLEEQLSKERQARRSAEEKLSQVGALQDGSSLRQSRRSGSVGPDASSPVPGPAGGVEGPVGLGMVGDAGGGRGGGELRVLKAIADTPAADIIKDLKARLDTETRRSKEAMDESRRKKAANDELEAKVQRLTEQIEGLLSPAGRKEQDDDGGQDSDGIERAVENKLQEYMELGITEKEDFVADIIFDYEEQIHLLRRRFLQQLQEQGPVGPA